ncbi:rhamnogalacturonan acetylesterase [Actinoplanes sichuanensis]|uniref:GDSL-type esterase/lipase family protein n=1 Tax=Actinoplanes sichuanensis TaxID=512349 RepID=A0ABW4AUJ1_9ACTN|nr:GDSL-type esterase/lipase family protein [Actinoplanes sichuanensis]BEL04416.1 rhamnogalacturonan acetylesterase [Actinoplanes sichuanensis]
MTSRDTRHRTWATGLTCAATAAGVGLFAPPANAALPTGCTGTAPIVCHYDVAPGNYLVTAVTGSGTGLSVEARRRILNPASAGTRTATVNVREPEGQPSSWGTGSPGLTLTFDGAAPTVTSVTVSAASNPLVAFLFGDSTVCDQSVAPYAGWGQQLTASVAKGAVIANYADTGESSESFRYKSYLFPAIKPLINPGNLVFLQFGHNDKTTTAAEYRDNLTAMIAGIRERGGVPVLVTPPVRRRFDGAVLDAVAQHVNSVGVNLPAEMRAVATASRVPLIDLTAKSKAVVEGLGPAGSAGIYLYAEKGDNTHFSEYGAARMAALVVDGIREQNLSLEGFLR